MILVFNDLWYYFWVEYHKVMNCNKSCLVAHPRIYGLFIIPNLGELSQCWSFDNRKSCPWNNETIILLLPDFNVKPVKYKAVVVSTNPAVSMIEMVEIKCNFWAKFGTPGHSELLRGTYRGAAWCPVWLTQLRSFSPQFIQDVYYVFDSIVATHQSL